MATASPVEIVWTLAAALGVLYGTLTLVQTVSDRAAALAMDCDEQTLLIARGHIRHAVIRLAKLCICLAIGLVAMSVAETSSSAGASLLARVTASGLLLIEAGMVLDTLLDYLLRRRLLRR